MRALQADHATHSTHDSREELGFVLHELRFEDVGGANADVASLLEEGGETRKERDVGVEFDLTCCRRGQRSVGLRTGQLNSLEEERREERRTDLGSR